MRCLLFPFAFFLMVSCTTREELERPDNENQNVAAEQAAANLGNPLLPNKGDLNAVNVRVSTPEELKKIDNGSNEELIWTDADHPDAEIPELTEIFENKRLGTGWQTRMSQAIKLARRRELPLIVWFHDSLISPQSNALGTQYLTTGDFLDWANKNAVLLRLDSGASHDDKRADSTPYHADSINSLQRRYGLTRKPSFAIITPHGKLAARIDGFDGMLPGFIIELKEGVARANKEFAQYKNRLSDRGFRNWTSATGEHHIFAKLMRYDADKRVVYLKESGGRNTRTKLAHFSQEDIEYLQSLPSFKREEKSSDTTEPTYEQI